MKTINIRKSTQFSEDSKIMVHAGERSMHVRGFDARSFTVEDEEEIYASHDWTQSNRIGYDSLGDGQTYIIMPRLTKKLAFIILITFMVCAAVFFFTKIRWSFIPLIPFGIYILLYLTLLRKKYLIVEQYE